MKKVLIIIGLLVVAVICFFQAMNIIFYRKFRKMTEKVISETGKTDQAVVTDADLQGLPPPVARYLKASGLVGMKRISFARIYHSGEFKPGKDKQFMPVKGEYLVTTHKPSFVWYGKVSIFPGFFFTARDYYYHGKGNMLVKILGTFPVVDAKSDITDKSAFGRCAAEMSMAPSFFLDRERIKWTGYGDDYAECTISDCGISTNTRLFFNKDGMLAKIAVERYYDRGDGKGTPEKFVGLASVVRDFQGLKMNTVFDGYWDLPEGELHYVHFVIDRVMFE